jgi:hypothetical protein
VWPLLPEFLIESLEKRLREISWSDLGHSLQKGSVVSTDKCQKENWDNQCCCNCRSQLIIKKHPWNSGNAKGSILDTLAYACACPEFGLEDGKKTIIYFDESHGMCEMWQPMLDCPQPPVPSPTNKSP